MFKKLDRQVIKMANGEKTLLDKILDSTDEMTKKQRVLADYIVSNYESAAFMNTKEMSKAANVSESTLLRLVDTLSFRRFADFQEALQQLVRTKMSTLRIYNNNQTDRKASLLDYIVSLETSIMSEMVANMNKNSFNLAVELLDTSKKVFVLGIGADKSCAQYLLRYLSILRDDVHLITSKTDPSLYNALAKNDLASSLLLVIHFPRYYKATLEICQLFMRLNTRIVGISDNVLAPLASIANVMLYVPVKYITMIDPLASALVLCHALLTGVVMTSPDKYRERMNDFYNLSRELNSVMRHDVPVPFSINGIDLNDKEFLI